MSKKNVKTDVEKDVNKMFLFVTTTITKYDTTDIAITGERYGPNLLIRVVFAHNMISIINQALSKTVTVCFQN